MKAYALVRQVVDIMVDVLGLSHNVAHSRRLLAPKKRLLRMERLESRHLLSASGLVDDGAIAPEDATTESFHSDTVVDVSSIAAVSHDAILYELASNSHTAPSSDDAELSELAAAEIEWDGAENVDESELSDSELESLALPLATIEANDETCVCYEDLAIYQADELLVDAEVDGESLELIASALGNGNLLMSGGSGGSGSSGGSGNGGAGGSSESEEYQLIVTTTLSSAIASLHNVNGLVNPLLERNGFASGGSNALNGADYVAITLPELPNYYVGRVTITGDLDSYAATPSYFMPVVTESPRMIDYSGGSTTFYLVPINDAKPEDNVIITIHLEVEPEINDDWLPQYDFTYINQTTTVTIVDDDQWQVRAEVAEDEALEGNPDVAACNPTRGSFNITRGMNSTATSLNTLCSDYTLDDTYPITVALQTGGSATRSTDYQLYLSGTNNGVGSQVTIPASSASVAVEVEPVEDRLFEPNETVTLTLSNITNNAGEGGTNTLPQYAIGSTVGNVTIYQAPEFLTGTDEGGANTAVNRDAPENVFHYGKPSVGDTVEYLVSNSVNQYHYVIEDNDYFEIEPATNSIVWKSLPGASCEDYTFTIVAKVVDNDRPQLYDEVTIEVTYGWATLTLCAIQPNPGTNDLFEISNGVITGHAFWVIESTSSLDNYCALQYNVTGSIPDHALLTYAALAYYNNEAWGYYPEHINVMRLLTEDNGVLIDDERKLANVTAHATFDVPSVGAFLNVLAETKSIDDDQTDKYRLQDMPDGFEHNCVDVAIHIASIIGVTIQKNQTTGSVCGYQFNGCAPGQFGNDLVNLYGGSYGAYSLHTTLPWDESSDE